MNIAGSAGFVNITTHVSGVSLGVELAHGREKGAHHGHGVGVRAESLDERFKTGVVVGVSLNLLFKDSKLLGGRELTVNDQERALEESRLFSELFNGVTTVFKDASVTINVGDTRDAGDSVHKSGVI